MEGRYDEFHKLTSYGRHVEKQYDPKTLNPELQTLKPNPTILKSGGAGGGDNRDRGGGAQGWRRWRSGAECKGRIAWAVRCAISGCLG